MSGDNAQKTQSIKITFMLVNRSCLAPKKYEIEFSKITYKCTCCTISALVCTMCWLLIGMWNDQLYSVVLH